MKLDEENISKRQKDEESIKALKELTKKLCSNDISTARLAAYNLSWMQEDGLAILTHEFELVLLFDTTSTAL